MHPVKKYASRMSQDSKGHHVDFWNWGGAISEVWDKFPTLAPPAESA